MSDRFGFSLYRGMLKPSKSIIVIYVVEVRETFVHFSDT